jgi:phosphatidylinositol glycan class Q protein
VDGESVAFDGQQFTFFSEPDVRRGRFLSLEPLVLDLSRYNVADMLSTASMSQLASNASLLDSRTAFQARIRDLGSTEEVQTPDLVSMLPVTELLNSSQSVNKHVAEALGTTVESTDRLRTLSSRLISALKALAYPLALLTFSVLVVVNVTSTILLAFLRTPISFLPSHPRLTDLSFTCAQLELRVQQAAFWHTQVAHLWDTGAKELARRHAEYVNFNNTVWLIANDIILGLAVGGMLITYSEQAGHIADIALTTSVSWLRSTSIWLMAWPAGLKLNAPLARFMGELFLWLLAAYEWALNLARPHLGDLAFILGSGGTFGLTLILALASDVLAFSTLHLALFYRVSARVHSWQLGALRSLFLLFRGRKRNTLRNRVDAQEYGLDQLAVGTILFTSLVFLAPTVLAYYVLFAVARAAVVAVHAVIEAVAALMNHFPLFSLTLWLKDGSRLPGGLQVKVLETSQDGKICWLALSVRALLSFLPSSPS